MTKFVTWMAALCMVSAAASAQECPADDNAICNPSEFAWTWEGDHYSGTLQYGEVTLDIGGDSFTTRAYRQKDGEYSIPGPTIVMKPGYKYVLRYENLLPYSVPSAGHNMMKDPDISNLHTHGLHISGESPGDDVTRFFEGGRGGDYVYDIRPDHMGGTYWYHAHHHGSTFLQVSTGGFGLIVIDDSADGIPGNVAAMTEREVVIGFLDPNAAGTGGDTLVAGTLSPTWTVNGKKNGNLHVPTNEWQHWRLLLADRDSRVKTVSVGSQCEVELLARDGVWRTQAPKRLDTNSLVLTGASRADLAVRCQGASTISVDNAVVASIVTTGNGKTDVHPYGDTGTADGGPSWSAHRPHYLRDLRDVTAVNNETVRMGARTINGKAFDHMVPTFRLPADSIQEWDINGARQHPFHLHVYHVQVQTECAEYEAGEYYDVVATNCTVRFDMNAEDMDSSVYAGRTIMHCHILEHEDMGAMGWMDVLGGTGAPLFPTGSTYSEYYELQGGPEPGTPPAAPGNLAATTVSSSQINLEWVDNSSDENGFELERSTDGTNFSPIDSVAADAITYSDIGLTPETTYHYRVRAVNASGESEYSAVASATTKPAVAGTSLRLGSLVVSTEGVGRGQKSGRADIVVVDDQDNPVAGAGVTGDFSGTFIESGVTGTTDANGQLTLTTSGSAKGGVSVTFCVTSITADGLSPYTGTASDCASL